MEFGLDGTVFILNEHIGFVIFLIFTGISSSYEDVRTLKINKNIFFWKA